MENFSKLFKTPKLSKSTLIRVERKIFFYNKEIKDQWLKDEEREYNCANLWGFFQYHQMFNPNDFMGIDIERSISGYRYRNLDHIKVYNYIKQSVIIEPECGILKKAFDDRDLDLFFQIIEEDHRDYEIFITGGWGHMKFVLSSYGKEKRDGFGDF